MRGLKRPRVASLGRLPEPQPAVFRDWGPEGSRVRARRHCLGIDSKEREPQCTGKRMSSRGLNEKILILETVVSYAKQGVAM